VAESKVAMQFDDAEQQHRTAVLGMWVFLATEILFFGGLFTVYTVYRSTHPVVFEEASHHLKLTLGAINTAVLLTSSFTVALAVHAIQGGKRWHTVLYFCVTLALGMAFLAIKGVEYSEEYHEHLVPWLSFIYPGPQAAEGRMFFYLYFAMTGLHALHMVAGIGVVGTVAIMTALGKFSREYYNPVEVTGLYWHFVDIVWIFLFPLLYLVGHR
jgi:cytochrome c oxidase subunit III